MKKLAKLFLAARLYLLIAPSAIWFTGAAMNQAVFIANHGKFPVMVNDKAAKEAFGEDGMAIGLDKRHCRMTSSTHLNWLSDWINWDLTIFSPGDAMLALSGMIARYVYIIWGALAIPALCK